MDNIKPAEGQIFEKWTILKVLGKLDKKHIFLECKCECGSIRKITYDSIRQKKSKGCLTCHQGSLTDRFSKSYIILENGCWEWQRYGHGDYGRIFAIDDNGKYRSQLAHRVSYRLKNGPIPQDMCICHTCDNRRCVNPAHLWLGTFKDNSQDKIKKGRDVKLLGEDHGLSKLTNQHVIDIRKMYPKYNSYGLSKIFKVSQSTIMSILKRRTWTHI